MSLSPDRRMEDREQTGPGEPRRYLQFTCPTCKRRVRVVQKEPAKLPAFFPFCSERCKLIDLGAWLDAKYRIPGKPDEESEPPAGGGTSPDPEDSHP